MERIGKVTLDEKMYCGTDQYSDGDIEDVLLDIVKNNSQEQYDAIIAREKNWPILYHLSDKRENIINWYPMDASADVLEIGAGCGAITGALAKKAKSVTCIDLSKRRSLINAYRNADKDNIVIKVGNFQDVEPTLTDKYDIITLIGVFEYGELYIDSKQPFVEFLSIIEKHLKPNGAVLVAIENKLGLKYWAGCQEDHIPEYFTGIEGYNNVKGVKTFSKNELTDIIKEAGYSQIEFYYPYPDYKFPMTIYSDYYLPKMGELNNNMRNFDKERMMLFDEAKVFDSLTKEQLFPYFSNSFFVEIKK